MRRIHLFKPGYLNDPRQLNQVGFFYSARNRTASQPGWGSHVAHGKKKNNKCFRRLVVIGCIDETIVVLMGLGYVEEDFSRTLLDIL